MANPKIKYDVEANVTGNNQIDSLVKQIEGLASTFDNELKDNALKAADALRALGEKQNAVQSFIEIKNASIAASSSLKVAQEAAQKFGQSLAGVENPTKVQVGQMQKLADAVKSAKAEILSQNTLLQNARSRLDSYGLSTRNLAETQRNLTQAISQQVVEIPKLVDGYSQLDRQAKEFTKSQQLAGTSTSTSMAEIAGSINVVKGALGAYAAAAGSISAIKGLAETADQFNSLQAQIKLATGEGELFKSSFDRVSEIALKTGSSLESTGNLFAKLTDAGKSAGLSAELATKQALGLTDSINQAIQLSGGSAASADAAITQLIQGLQSGVLRGEEFNSIMEQSPRLSKALADGLGVTTGELRKMANQGQLTTDVVITSLKSQASVLKSEFETLPPTVGRALTNLSSSWTLYVGEADKATGASKTAAAAIDFLSQNLSSVASVLIGLGKATAAFTALRLAQHFLGIGQAAQASAAGIVANTTAMNSAAAAASGAASNAGRFAAILGGLKTFTLVGVIANLEVIGKTLGETIAKLNGYKDKSREVAVWDKIAEERSIELVEARKKQIQKTEDLVAAQLSLSRGSQSLIKDFDGLVKGGKKSGEAADEIAKKFDIQTPDGITQLSAVLKALELNGKISAETFNTEWSKALDGQDLQKFLALSLQGFAALQKSVKDSEESIAKSGKITTEQREKMAEANKRLEAESILVEERINAGLREAIKRAGLDFNLISGGMSKAAKSSINDAQLLIDNIDRVKQSGADVGIVLSASLQKAIKSADTQAALDEVKKKVDDVKGVLGEQVTKGLLDQATEKSKELKNALLDIKPGINDATEAMRLLGVVSDESLKNTATKSQEAYQVMQEAGTASAREMGLAFQKAASDAIAANNGIAPAWVTAQAEVRGYTVAVDESGKSTVKAADDGARAMAGLANSAGNASNKVRDIGTNAQASAEQLKKLDEINSRYGQGNADRAGKYDRAGSGSVLKKDELKGVDNGGLQSLIRKRDSGTLSDADLATAEAAVKASKSTLASLDAVAKLNPAAISFQAQQSANADFQAASSILEQLKAVKLQGNRSMTVNINQNDGLPPSSINTDDAGAKAIVDALKRAKRAAGK